MSDALYPLQFHPVYKSMLWGGDRIRKLYDRPGAPDHCGESWEISVHPSGPSVIANGILAGQTLAQAVAAYREKLIGTAAQDPGTFPLLFKVIDARQALSMQVHPNETTAALTGGDPKTELWYILDAEPGACIHGGMRDGITKPAFRQALEENRGEQCVMQLAAKRGDIFFIPGGMVHSIGAGYLIYEVQQSSDTTYRLYDWARLDEKTGRPRELHIEKGMQTIDPSLPPPRVIPAIPYGADHNTLWSVLSHACFVFRCMNLCEPTFLEHTAASFQVLFVDRGACRLISDAGALLLPKGSSVLIPAGVKARLEPAPTAHLLVTSLRY